MDRKRLILYIVLFVFHLSAFLYAYRIDSLDPLQLVGHIDYIGIFKYLALLGLFMIGLDFMWSFLEWKNTRAENKKLMEENTNLKAKLYDIQESARRAEASKGL